MSEVPPSHPLDRPIWSALTTRQQALAEGASDRGDSRSRSRRSLTWWTCRRRALRRLAGCYRDGDRGAVHTRSGHCGPPDFKVLLADTASR